MRQIIRVALDVPLEGLFDYYAPAGEPLGAADIGLRVRVPFGRQMRIGVLTALPERSELAETRLKEADAVLRDLPPLPAEWFRLCEFCAAYYHAPLGEVMLSTLPARLRRIDPPRARTPCRAARTPSPSPAPALTDEQEAALAVIAGEEGFQQYLLHGVTGFRAGRTSARRWRWPGGRRALWPRSPISLAATAGRRCCWCRKST